MLFPENALPLASSFRAHLDGLGLTNLVLKISFSVLFSLLQVTLLPDSGIGLLPLHGKWEDVPSPLLLLDRNQLVVLLQVWHDLGK